MAWRDEDGWKEAAILMKEKEIEMEMETKR